MKKESNIGTYIVCATLAEANDIADACWTLYYAARVAAGDVAEGEPLGSSWEQTNRYVNPIVDPAALVAGALVPMTIRMRDDFDGQSPSVPTTVPASDMEGRELRAERAKCLLGCNGEVLDRVVALDFSGAVAEADLPQEWKDALAALAGV